jgi:hypothetical protein
VIAGKKRLAPLHDRVDDGRGVLPEQDLKVSDAVYGLCFAAWTVGMVGGALVAARRVPGAALALAVLGRALAAYNGLRNGAEPFALAGGGLLVAAIGARMTLALAGAIPFLAAAVGLAFYRWSARRAPAAPPEPALAER